MSRIYLKSGDTIKLTRGKIFEEWQINSIIGEGASSICYSATCDGKSGRLKEFYPLEYCSLTRQENNILTATNENSAQLFQKMQQDYLNCCKILNDARQKENGTLLNNFLPPYEILYDENGNIYIWTPDDKHGINFEDYLNKKNIAPQRKLFEILRIIEHLTQCIKIFHMLGIVHLDLKPSNFLITTMADDEDINPANISIFDLNSIYNLDSDLPCITQGTRFFAAPELQYGKVGNRADIFSIGAILFYAISYEFYQESFFQNINQIVARSELVKSFISDSNASFCTLLAKILTKCLAKLPQKRYSCCEKLIEDLKKLIALMMPEITTETLKNLNKKLVLIDAKQIISPKIVLQNMLYKYPVFPEKDCRHLNIVVIGGGTFAQNFIDEILQALQIPYFDETGKFFERKICIQVFSPEPESDCENYLNLRPAVSNFVSINKILKNICDSYGRINFLKLPSDKIAKKIVSTFDREIHYVFIAMGDDQTNLELAKEFVNEKINCPVNFSVQDENFSELKSLTSTNPIFITENITPEIISPQLKNWAFNVHLIWRGNLSELDLETVKENFFEKYNLESSLAFALSMKYKFFSVGIKIENENYNAAAFEFEEKILNAEILNSLAYYEHRRWVIEKLCAGMKPPLTPSGSIDYEHCLAMIRDHGNPQDKKEGLHPCIVKSRREFNPSMPDDLDKMSLNLQATLKIKASEIKSTQHFKRDLKLLRESIGETAEFKKFEFYLKQILNGNKYHSRNFKSYLEELKASFSNFPLYTKEILNQHVENLRRDFILIAESNISREYKSYDFKLIQQLPFIVTYSPPNIAVAFDDKNNFSNIASATVLNPSKITYLYFFENKSRVNQLCKKIYAVFNYLIERKIRAKISFIIAVENSAVIGDLKKIFEEIGVEVTLKNVSGIDDAEKFFLETLKNNPPEMFDGSNNLFSSQYQNLSFVEKIYSEFPYFELNSSGFKICHNCENLQFISSKFDLRAHEIFALSNFKFLSVNNSLIHYADYIQKLWTISSIDSFNKCRELLKDYDNDAKHFNSVKISKKKIPLVTIQYFLPNFIGESITNLLNRLMSLGLIKNFSSKPADDSLEISICSEHQIEPALNKIFADISNFMEPEFLRVKQERNFITIFFSSLVVKNLCTTASELEILQKLSENHLILNLKVNRRQQVSFNYASKFTKKIFTDPNFSMLKSYVYFKALKSGYFEEVFVDVEFSSDDINAQKFDCLLTKKSSSLVISFAEKFSTEQLHQFNNLTEKLAVAVKKVFIVSKKPNAEEFEKAADLGIILVQNSVKICKQLQNIIDEKTVNLIQEE